VDIDALKIVGFKSFADPVEIPIGKGITGIVGPNGCGKSNLIEALRWAMGETSAKRMRADGMDDVIFGGTDKRMPRASAEVTISIDNSARKAPVEFNGDARLEVSRRISRGEGSSYKVNAKAARAKDVQVLFKDAGVGAGSSALVSQGKVAAIINAKPTERRNILEEAAGVAGLSSRRHEAELRLKGTEQNLERADDLEKNLNDQLGSLRRQARQAKRRRDIDGMIRAAEAAVLLVRWNTVEGRLATGQANFEANEEQVKQVMLVLQLVEAALAKAEAEAAPAIKAKADAEIALALARTKVESVRKEAQAAKAALASALKAVDRTKTDIARQKAEIGNSGEEYEELKDRLALTIDDRDYDKVLIEEANIKAVEARDALSEISAEVSRLAEALAGAKIERTAAERRLTEIKQRKISTDQKLADVQRRLSEAQSLLASMPKVGEELGLAQEMISEAEQVVVSTSETYSLKLDDETKFKTNHATLVAQLAALSAELSVLLSGRSEADTLASKIRVQDGYEAAVAAAFGEGLNAGIGAGEHRWWQKSPIRISAPEGARAMAEVLKVPDELLAAVSGVGIVNSTDEAVKLAASLQPGQIIVTLAGGVWRWDGYRSEGVSGADEEIRRTSRIEELEKQVSDLDVKVAKSKSELEAVGAAVRDAKLAADQARHAVKAAREKFDAIKRSQEAVEAKRRELEAQVISLTSSMEQLSLSAEQEAEALIDADALLSSLPDIKKDEQALQNIRSRQSLLNAAYEKAREELDKAKRDAEARHLMIQNIEQQMRDFDKRMVAAREHIAELQKRLAEGELEMESLAATEALGPQAEQEAMEALEEAAIVHEAAVATAVAAEEALSNARISVRDAEAKLGTQKEERARFLAEMKGSQEAQQELVREISERLSCEPSGLEEISGLTVSEGLPELDICDARLQRLIKERDGIGTVNLLAEEQLVEVEGRLGAASKVKEELREAVRRLRKTISEFEQESRERLTEAYALIDGHFRNLFTRLFGGGHAYLKLSESDDILHAGLEIYACPPGKKLQTMSLMSGGEQALAALALIFAAFLIRPAPVCVLDEVDAPLDDSNVDLLCSLVADMAKDGTKFLMITHHSLTMAKCDRLFGVTMMERGVSRVASLDMDTAIKLIDA